jgi:hypothetical protein
MIRWGILDPVGREFRGGDVELVQVGASPSGGCHLKNIVFHARTTNIGVVYLMRWEFDALEESFRFSGVDFDDSVATENRDPQVAVGVDGHPVGTPRNIRLLQGEDIFTIRYNSQIKLRFSCLYARNSHIFAFSMSKSYWLTTPL